jgi:hypothetical protein
MKEKKESYQNNNRTRTEEAKTTEKHERVCPFCRFPLTTTGISSVLLRTRTSEGKKHTGKARERENAREKT